MRCGVGSEGRLELGVGHDKRLLKQVEHLGNLADISLESPDGSKEEAGDPRSPDPWSEVGRFEGERHQLSMVQGRGGGNVPCLSQGIVAPGQSYESLSHTVYEGVGGPAPRTECFTVVAPAVDYGRARRGLVIVAKRRAEP